MDIPNFDEFDSQDLHALADVVVSSSPAEEALVLAAMTEYHSERLSIDGARRYLERARDRAIGTMPADS